MFENQLAMEATERRFKAQSSSKRKYMKKQCALRVHLAATVLLTSFSIAAPSVFAHGNTSHKKDVKTPNTKNEHAGGGGGGPGGAGRAGAGGGGGAGRGAPAGGGGK